MKNENDQWNRPPDHVKNENDQWNEVNPESWTQLKGSNETNF